MKTKKRERERYGKQIENTKEKQKKKVKRNERNN